MSKVRLEPQFFDHERWERLGAEAVVLHVAALGYTCHTLSDGIVSAARVRGLSPIVWDPAVTTAALVAEGVWEPLEDGSGYRVCQVQDDLRNAGLRGDEQPSRAFVEDERERSRKRKEEWKKRNAVPNAGQNGAKGSEDQSSQVKDPSGPVLDLGLGAGPQQIKNENAVPNVGLSTECQHGDPLGLVLLRTGMTKCAKSCGPDEPESTSTSSTSSTTRRAAS